MAETEPVVEDVTVEAPKNAAQAEGVDEQVLGNLELPVPEEKNLLEAKGGKGQQNLRTMSGGGVGAPTDPRGGYVTRSLPLTQTDDGTGAFTYEQPLVVPPGRNGLQPNLALRYSSQGGEVDGWLGYGWELTIPSIERVNKYGVGKLYSDPVFQSSLSGDLVMSATGTYAARTDGGDFLSYTFDGVSWTVKDKAGIRYMFGSATETRMDDPSNANRVYKWMLTEVRDVNDNYIRYEYTKITGQIYPSRIIYTGFGSTDGVFEVVFNRATRPDTSKLYYAGFEVVTSDRISEIVTKVGGTMVRKYELGYGSGDNGSRSMLRTFVETGWDDQGVATTLPPAVFEYLTDSNPTGWGWSSYSIPASTPGYMFADFNGDGLTDYAYGSSTTATSGSSSVYLNNGNNTWSLASSWNLSIPTVINNSGGGSEWMGRDPGTRFVDVNGDGRADAVQGYTYKPSSGPLQHTRVAYLSTGTGWASSSTWAPEFSFSARDYNGFYDAGARLADLDGDGLTDVSISGGPSFLSGQVGNHYNNGAGWTKNGTAPISFGENLDTGGRVLDINGDGLADFVYGQSTQVDNGTSVVYINNGKNVWSQDANWIIPVSMVVYNGQGLGYGIDTGARLVDVNGDGLTDVIQAVLYKPNTGSPVWTKKAYLNTGSGWSQISAWEPPVPFMYRDQSGVYDGGARLIEINGDGLTDIVKGGGISGYPYSDAGLYVSLTKPELLSKTVLPTGGTKNVGYKATPLFRNGSTLLNPNLPFIVNAVETLTTVDGFGNAATSTRSYEGGRLWHGGPFDRRFAGFGKITTTDPAGYVEKIFFHQGDTTNSSQGEYSDHEAKIGKKYRVETLDTSGNLFGLTLSKWDRSDLGGGRSFVMRTRETVLAYDGNSTHKDKASEYAYDSHGNVTSRVEWGEVMASTDGSYTDTGTDKRTTDVAYVTNSGRHIFSLPQSELVKDQSGVKKSEKRLYYDALALGSVDKGNLTKEEYWLANASYVNAQKTYNNYGLVTQQKDLRAKNTDYVYDAYSLYPIRITEPLGLVTERTYDYSSGQVKQVVDPNLLVTQMVYDGLDRRLEEKHPDQSASSTLVSSVTYAYGDGSLGAYIKRTTWLDGSNGVEEWTYFDGFDRPIQVRKESETAGTYVVSDLAYNNRGLLSKESLPYFATGSSRTAATSNPVLYTTYGYDAAKRVNSLVNAVGTTSTSYDDWKTSVTDPRGKVKHLYRDAFERLNRVDEVNGASIYTTAYEYDVNDNLTKITDALSNVRSFTYDGLGRRLIAQDLHVSADATFGTWTYSYDDAGNMTSVVDPKSQTVNVTFDDLNRPLTEDFTGESGTETFFTYDTCTYGKGKLCTATTAGATTTYLYGPTGYATRETKTISSTDYQTDTTYDRQGNILVVTLPDGSAQRNTYGAGGLLDKVEQKESGGSWSDIMKSFDWSPLAQPATIVYGNNATTINSYDATKLYRLTNKLTTSGGTNLQNVTYTYDANGNVTRLLDSSQTNAAKTLDFSYDDLNRLSGATSTDAVSGGNYTQSYVYDPIGNLTNRSDVGLYLFDGNQGASYANPHAATTIAGISYGYDNNGNLVSSASDTYAWDYKNRMLSANVGGTASSYAYDHTGARVLMTESATTTAYPSKSYSVKDGLPTKHIFAGNILVATVEGTTSTAVTRFVHTDHLTGSSVVSSATGTVVELMDYYPYGGIRIDEKAGEYSETRKFAGHEYDVASGLTYMGSRYYDGNLGRFLSEDPAFLAVGDPQKLQQVTKITMDEYLSSPQHLNSYSYAFNNPLVYIDEDGKFAIRTFGVGLLQGGKAGLNVAATIGQATLAGGALAVGQAQIAGLLTAGAFGNLDSGLTDASNGLSNVVGAFKDQAPSKIQEQGPYRDMAASLAGDTALFDSAATAGNGLYLTTKDVPEFLSKAGAAYKIYENARSAGVGMASGQYLLGKSADILFKVGDFLTQVGNDGKGIPDVIENKMVPAPKSKLKK